MSLFVLQRGFRVVATPTGGRVIHVRTGDALELTAAELQLLARANVGGLDIDDPRLGATIRKLANLGLLVRSREAREKDSVVGAGPPPAEALRSTASAPPSAATYAPMVADEPVPLLRGDLKLTRKGTSSLYDITDPLSGKTFTLYDFELSLARMLDGSRRGGEVVEAGERLGIPVNLVSLGQFIRQLNRYGFLAPSGSPLPARAEGTAWPKRTPWDESLRALYQTGVRLNRQGRHAEAAEYFEAMLQQNPSNAEATEMLAEVRQHLGTVVPANEEADFFIEVGEPLFRSAEEEKAAPPTRGKRRLSGFAVGAAAVLVAGALLGAGASYWLSRKPHPARVPSAQPGRTGTTGAGPADASSAEPRAMATVDAGAQPRASAVADWGAPPDAGPPLEARAPRDAGAPSVGVEVPGGTGPAEIGKRALGPDRRWSTYEPSRRGRVTMAQLRAPANGTVSWKVSPEQRLGRGARVGTLRTNREGAPDLPLVAGAAGLILLRVPDQTRAKKDELLAEVVYQEGYLQTVMTGARPAQDWVCEVVDEASHQRADCKVVSAAPRGEGFFVTATTEPLWFDTCAAPRLRLAPP